MKQIFLTQGKIALVDDEDFEFISSFKWCYKKGRNDKCTGYAERGVNMGGKKIKTFKMHRVLMGLTHGDKRLVDHIDGNGLNNQRSNLRIATHSQNGKNRKPYGASRYLGVAKITRKKTGISKWVAAITVHSKKMTLGQFPFTPEGEKMAALKYNEVAKKYDSIFPRFNIIE